jgi:hypothetical protein
MLNPNVLAAVFAQPQQIFGQFVPENGIRIFAFSRLSRFAHFHHQPVAYIVFNNVQAESRSGVFKLRWHVHGERFRHGALPLVIGYRRKIKFLRHDAAPRQPLEIRIPCGDDTTCLNVVDYVLNIAHRIAGEPEVRLLAIKRISGTKDGCTRVLKILMRSDFLKVSFRPRFKVKTKHLGH